MPEVGQVGEIKPTGSTRRARASQAATLLDNGGVLIAGAAFAAHGPLLAAILLEANQRPAHQLRAPRRRV